MTPLLAARGVALPGRLLPTDLDLLAGQRVALIGPNGGGKTSLLRALAGLEGSAGTVTVDGSPLPAAGARRWRLLGLMPASREIGWPIPVRDLLRLGVPPVGDVRFADHVEAFELGGLLDRRANQLSTGERARVQMARLAIAAPRVILLDEPLSNLDPYWVLRFLEMIDRQAAEGATILCALHDLTLLARFDRALLVTGARLVFDTTPEAMNKSAAFADAFRIAPTANGSWKISSPADPRSSQ